MPILSDHPIFVPQSACLEEFGVVPVTSLIALIDKHQKTL